MAASVPIPSPMELPKLPISRKDFIPYLNKHPQTPIPSLLAPFKAFEGSLRKAYAQEPDHKALKDPFINTVPVFAGHEDEFRVRARTLEVEAENERYIMPLDSSERKPSGAPAIVGSFKEFKKNFDLFSESSLVDMDWSNVVAAGSSVVTALLPVPDKYSTSKRALREYYHEKLAPASDVDLFLYGLNEAEAALKIKQIETKIRDSILQETTTIRTKNAITIASQYPIRHVQIVLRLYKSVSEILTGFDVDCSCVAYDGAQVFAAPRAITAFMTQTNTIDLSRRSPSYENRLSKYSHRGFEIYWPLLERSRVDPTIFERSFARTLGLSKLLVLEKLPRPDDRDRYLMQRRAERGRPPLNLSYRNRHKLAGNVKDQQPDDVAEWIEDEEISNYHTFKVPYGPKFYAKKIEKLLYTKDLLLNAEWNVKKDRESNLHRHPCFFGFVDDILKDCCGQCPAPTTDEEKELAAKERKTYVYGDLQFTKDDPGRQAIGSFNPLTDDDWTEMAYIGNTARLCQAIVDGDLEHVQDWCEQGGADSIDRRDHTGRTPLHLAAMVSTPEVVQCLIDHGARIVARLVDGFTALHIAARRGNTKIVNALLKRSEANEEEEEARRAKAKKTTLKAITRGEVEYEGEISQMEGISDSGDEDGLKDDDESEGSFVKVKRETLNHGETLPDDEWKNEPDIYDVNVLAWDSPVSPLHLAVLGGHVDVIETLCSMYGADVLLPVKLLDKSSRSPRAAILTLILAQLPPNERAEAVTKTLLSLGASSAQADMDEASALHYTVYQENVNILDILFDYDRPAATSALNHLRVEGSGWHHAVSSPLITAIKAKNLVAVGKLLSFGAKPTVEYEDYLSTLYRPRAQRGVGPPPSNREDNQRGYNERVQQPIVLAAEHNLPTVIQELLRKGVNPNTLEMSSYAVLLNPKSWMSVGSGTLLDVVRRKLKELREYDMMPNAEKPPPTLSQEDDYLSDIVKGTYQYWSAEKDLQLARKIVCEMQVDYEQKIQDQRKKSGYEETMEARRSLLRDLEVAENMILERGGKSFWELHPDVKVQNQEHPKLNFDFNFKAEPFRIKFEFAPRDMTDSTREGYVQLFEAAWEGDCSKVKSLTLAPWGTESEYPPLKIATPDKKGFSPFSIAVFRGHLQLARMIVDIAQAQYQPPEKVRKRFDLRPFNGDDGDETDSDNEITLYSELVDENFTIENVACVAKTVKSEISPLAMLSQRFLVWRLTGERFYQVERDVRLRQTEDLSSTSYGTREPWTTFEQYWIQLHEERGSLLRYALWKNDINLVRFFLQLGTQLASSHRGNDNESRLFKVDPVDFQYAIQSGHTSLIGEIIKVTGAGIPLDEIIEDYGLEVQQKPKARFYQGLSIHGTKRKDWAQARRQRYQMRVVPKHPPLLEAAYRGSIESVEWFMSDAPMRMYRHFASANQVDIRLKTLSAAAGGIDKMLSTFLSSRSDLAIHCAILSKPEGERTIELLKYLIDAIPQSLEARSKAGWTPLLLAFSLNRFDAAKVLIEAGADQLKRDKLGRNLMHLVFVGVDDDIQRNAVNAKAVHALINKRVLQDLSVERCAEGPGALTPLGRWLYSLQKCDDKNPSAEREILKLLLECSNGADLVMMDGSGQLPLHVAVKMSYQEIVRFLVEENPALLYRENAMGQTPLELAETMWLQHHMKNPPNLESMWNNRQRPTRSFGFFPGDRNADEQNVVKTWLVCKEAAAKYSTKRTLVSLNDANEVSKRLAKKGKQIEVEGIYQDGDAKDLDFRDEVSEWYHHNDLASNKFGFRSWARRRRYRHSRVNY